MTDSDGNEIGKLFIGGLSQTTTSESMLSYFSQYGEVDEAVVMMDNRTGRSRGFGYVKYKNPELVDNVLDSKPHVLDSKEIDAKQCNINMKGKNRRSLKIFVGGIALDQEADTIRKYFEQYGSVTDVSLMMDPAKQRHRGFAFVGFEDENIVKRLIAMHYVNMNGKQVEIKAMEPPNYGRKSPIPSTTTQPNFGYSSKGPGERPIGQPSSQPSTWRQTPPYPPQPVNWSNHPGQVWSQTVWPQWQQSGCDQHQWASWTYPNTSWYQPSPAPVYPAQNPWASAPPAPIQIAPSQPQTSWTTTSAAWESSPSNSSLWTQAPTHHGAPNDYEPENYNEPKSVTSCSVNNGLFGQLPGADYNNWLYGSKDMKIISIGVEGESQAPPPGGSGDYNRSSNSTAYPYHIRR